MMTGSVAVIRRPRFSVLKEINVLDAALPVHSRAIGVDSQTKSLMLESWFSSKRRINHVYWTILLKAE